MKHRPSITSSRDGSTVYCQCGQWWTQGRSPARVSYLWSLHVRDVARWDAWAVREARCPYCVDITCPLEWDTTCDCWMAPEPPADHSCAVCLAWHAEPALGEF